MLIHKNNIHVFVGIFILTPNRKEYKKKIQVDIFYLLKLSFEQIAKHKSWSPLLYTDSLIQDLIPGYTAAEQYTLVTWSDPACDHYAIGGPSKLTSSFLGHDQLTVQKELYVLMLVV